MDSVVRALGSSETTLGSSLSLDFKMAIYTHFITYIKKFQSTRISMNRMSIFSPYYEKKTHKKFSYHGQNYHKNIILWIFLFLPIKQDW